MMLALYARLRRFRRRGGMPLVRQRIAQERHRKALGWLHATTLQLGLDDLYPLRKRIS